MRSTRAGDRYSRALAAVHAYSILGSPPEAEFDIFPALCCATFDAPAALLQFFDGEQLWTKAEAGTPHINRARRDVPLRDTFEAAHTLHITGDGGFFCGAPVFTPDQIAIGAIGVYDERPRGISTGRLQAIRTISAAVTHALEARKRLRHPPAPPKRTLYAVGRTTPATSAEHGIDAVLTKIEAGRRLLRTESSEVMNAGAFISAMQQLLGDNDEPHVLVIYSVAEPAAAELIEQARRARLLCNQDLVAFIGGEHLVMLLRDMPVAAGYQAAKRFAHAQLNTNYRVTEVHGPIADVRAFVDDLTAQLQQRR
jgi:hypothetical protein